MKYTFALPAGAPVLPTCIKGPYGTTRGFYFDDFFASLNGPITSIVIRYRSYLYG